MGACFICFSTGHRARDYRNALMCGIDNCNRNHHQLLHEEQRDITIMAGQLAALQRSKTALGTIAVRVQNDTRIETEATLLFKEGSNTTLGHKSLTQRLYIKGRPETFRISGVAGITNPILAEEVEFKILTDEGPITITALSAPSVCLPVPKISWPKIQT